LQAGIDYAVYDWLSVFGEYKGNYTINDMNLVGGGSMKTNIVTNALNLGLSYHWK
jgi:lipid A oxidase